MAVERKRTAIDVIAETYLDDWAALDPAMATYVGLPGHDRGLPGLDPAWHDELSRSRRRTLAALAAARPVDACDRVTAAALREQLEVAEELHDADEDLGALGNLASAQHIVRDVFDLMPTATDEDWATVAARLGAVPGALRGYAESLRTAASRGRVVPRRQVAAAMDQCVSYGRPDGFFAGLAAGATTGSGPLPAALAADLAAGAVTAATAYRELASFLTDELMPRAPDRDPVGRDRYAVHSRAFLGTRVDLDETYAWGQQELADITAQMEVVAREIGPGASVPEAVAKLDASPQYALSGTDALRAWMQATSDAAIDALDGRHFDIPAPIRRLECLIAPTEEGGIYYTGPSEDLVTRPGRMWWSVPRGETRFATWRERATVYHEGVPGHHLQIGQAVCRSGTLNRWRRLASDCSGHSEGWALYAERLMVELGFFADPGDRLGALDAQSLRAARVVLDIGIHCELPAPAEVGGGGWDYDKAWRFLTAHCRSMSEPALRYELDRYLGWPGQAPSYKVGERLWLQLREQARAAAGAAFDLKSFHRRVLDLGSVGLDVLRDAVLGTGLRVPEPPGHVGYRAQVAELVRVDHGADRLDLPVGDVEGEHVDHPSLGVVGDRAGLAVDPGRPLRRTEQAAPAEQAAEQPQHRLPPDEWLTERLRLAAAVAVEDHVRGEQAEQRVQVAAFSGGEEPAGEFLAFRAAGRLGRTVGPRVGGGDVLAGPGEDLPAVHLALARGPGDGRVVVSEHLAEHEHRPFHRGQRLHQHQERHRQRVGQLGVLGRPGLVQRHHDRLGQPVSPRTSPAGPGPSPGS